VINGTSALVPLSGTDLFVCKFPVCVCMCVCSSFQLTLSQQRNCVYISNSHLSPLFTIHVPCINPPLLTYPHNISHLQYVQKIVCYSHSVNVGTVNSSWVTVCRNDSKYQTLSTWFSCSHLEGGCYQPLSTFWNPDILYRYYNLLPDSVYTVGISHLGGLLSPLFKIAFWYQMCSKLLATSLLLVPVNVNYLSVFATIVRIFLDLYSGTLGKVHLFYHEKSSQSHWGYQSWWCFD
jgi:hypothetical protein